MTDGCDYPAAHSMDSAWFAVDLDGHVARFETGEAGAVPRSANLGEDDARILEVLEDRVATTAVIYDLAGFERKHAKAHVEIPRATGTLMFLETLEGLGDILQEVESTPVQTTSGAGLLFRAIDPGALAEFHRRKACRGCFPYWKDSDEFGVWNTARFGLFDYQHIDPSIAGPYVLQARPSPPVTVAELPRDPELKIVQYAGRFALTPALQPAALWACDSWGHEWVDLDGRSVRPFPGFELDVSQLPAESVKGEGGMVFLHEALVLPEAPLVQFGDAPPAPEPRDPEKKPRWRDPVEILRLLRKMFRR